MLFSTPLIRALRKKFKDAYIAVICNPSCRDALTGNPNIDEIIIFDDRKKQKSISGKIDFTFSLRKKGFDTVFLLHRSLFRALIASFAGIGKRIGHFYSKRNFILTDIVRVSAKDMHKIEYFLKLAEYAGCDIKNKNMDFFFSKDDADYAENLLKENGIEFQEGYIVINPGGNWGPKTWPEHKYSELCDELIKKYGIKIVITGAEKDIKKALNIQDKSKNRFVILCGMTNLKQLGAVLKRSKFVISGDTGPMHIALAVGAEIIALFGPTSSRLTGPYGGGNHAVIQKGVGCEVPCYDENCRDNKCMDAITTEDVMKEVKRLL